MSGDEWGMAQHLRSAPATRGLLGPPLPHTAPALLDRPSLRWRAAHAQACRSRGGRDGAGGDGAGGDGAGDAAGVHVHPDPTVARWLTIGKARARRRSAAAWPPTVEK